MVAAESAVTHWLYVNLVSGHELLSADDDGFSDPYCDLFVWCPSKDKCKHMHILCGIRPPGGRKITLHFPTPHQIDPPPPPFA